MTENDMQIVEARFARLGQYVDEIAKYLPGGLLCGTILAYSASEHLHRFLFFL